MASLDVPQSTRASRRSKAGDGGLNQSLEQELSIRQKDAHQIIEETDEREQSMVNIYGFIQRSIGNFETLAGSKQQTADAGAFIRGENAHSIVKCEFQDNSLKPKTVMDAKLSVNILDTELISPIFRYQATVEYLIKDLISNQFMSVIDKEIDSLNNKRISEGKKALSDEEVLFKKLARIQDITDDDAENPGSKRYAVVSKAVMECINNLRAEIDSEAFDPLNLRENLKRIIDVENIRNRGFNTAVNLLTSILDASKMEYQYIENLKNAREVLVREYNGIAVENLPDERYQIRLRYFDNAKLNEERKAYEAMIRSFQIEIGHLWDVLRTQYDKSKAMKRITDFGDLARLYKKYIAKKYKIPYGEPVYEDITKVWDGVSFTAPAETEVEKMNRTFVYEKDKLRKKLAIIRERLEKMYGSRQPAKRRVMEEQLHFLEAEFSKFDNLINPFHVQPGLLIDIDLTSIKRKKTTLNGMAHVLNEFLRGVSKGFTDQAWDSFRRSSAAGAKTSGTAGKASETGTADTWEQFADMINKTMTLEAPAADAIAAAAEKEADEVEPKPKRGRKPKALKEAAATEKEAAAVETKPKRGRKPGVKKE